MNSSKRIVAALLVVAFAGLVGTSAGSVHASTTAGNTITIWTDSYRVSAFQKIGNQYAAAHPGVSIKVVQKQFGASGAGTIGGDLATVNAADAPDVISAAHDWTGQLSANGLVVPLHLSKAAKKLFPAYTLNAFSYGTAVKNLYAVPTQIENVGLVVNTKLVKVPTTFTQLHNEAMAFKHKHHTAVGIAVPDGPPNGDPYHMYSFFSGLGGYVFGKNKAGNLDPSNIGIANKVFIKNASRIDKWNKEGLIRSTVDYNTAKNLFEKGKVPFWVTGPWESQSLKQSGIKFKIIHFPKIVKASVPFLGVQGAMVTKYASTHGVKAIALDFVENYLTKTSPQNALASAEGRYPASIPAGKNVHNSVLAAFGRAGKGGVPMPNIPQMNSVWQYFGQAWVVSTKGSGATPAAKAFKNAAHQIRLKIG
jgi:arabinogalactan oligomer / maltooligosaccharide transport system substrate-binding protein